MAARRGKGCLLGVVFVVLVGCLVAFVGQQHSAALVRSWISDPVQQQRGLRWLTEQSGVAVSVADASVQETRDGWRVVCAGVLVETPRLSVQATTVESDVPAFWPALLARRLLLGDVKVDGVRVTVHSRTQAPPTARPGPFSFRARSLSVTNGTLVLPADGPLPAAGAEGLQASLEDVVWAMGDGLVDGEGTLTVRQWRAGPLRVDAVSVDDVRFSRREISLGQTQFSIAGGGGRGDITLRRQQGQRSEVRVEAEIHDTDFATLVSATTGQPSPVAGRIAGKVTVDAGGARAPGASEARADWRLEDGRVVLGDHVSAAARTALRLAPSLTVRGGEVVLGPTEGQFVLSNGRVLIERLVHGGKRRDLAARGSVVGRSLDLVVRLVPKNDPETRAGIGLVLSGKPGEMNVRLAEASEIEGLR